MIYHHSNQNEVDEKKAANEAKHHSHPHSNSLSLKSRPVKIILAWTARLLKKVTTCIAYLWEVSIYERILVRGKIERIYMLMCGHIYFQTLRTAVEFDLFTLLRAQKSLTRRQIMQALCIDEQPARILLLGLTTLGLVHQTRLPWQKEVTYRNTYISHVCFTKQSDKNIISYVKLQHHVMYKAMFHYYEATKSNNNSGLREFAGQENTLYGRLVHDEKLESVFQDAMQELTRLAITQLTRHLDLSRVSSLVDVGGGDGTNIIALAKQNPHLKARVFDYPEVCRIAEKNIAAHGYKKQLGVIEGDCFRDNFPKDADCFFFAHFFTIWSKEKDKYLLKKCYDHLPKGGQVIIFNMMQNDNERGPWSAVGGSVYFQTLATGEGMLYTAREYQDWMREAGFKNVKCVRLPKDHAAIIGTKS